MYSWDLSKLVNRYMNRKWRKPKMLSFLYELAKPLNKKYADFETFKGSIDWKLKFTFQVIYLEHYLNNEYSYSYNASPVVRQNDIDNEAIISVQTIDFLPLNTTFFQIEQVSNMVTYFNSEAETEPIVYFGSEYDVAYHFRVKVPSSFSLSSKEIEMRKKIDFYRQASKQYSIEYY